MPIRIDPRVDFACKLMLGSPEHSAVTIHFLNSVLQLRIPIVSVKILNPLVGKERPEEKVIVLDVLARDSWGRLFNIEMQTQLALSFPNRLVYYNCKNFTRQIKSGEGYERLRAAISICLLDRRMFEQSADLSRWHHSFRLRCDQNPSFVLTQDFEFHVFELPKFVPSGDNIEELPAEEKWLYLFTHATEMEPETLAEILNEPPYREAIGVLQMISKSEEDLQYYEDRLKFLRDQQSWLEDARQDGRQEGFQEGRQEGRQEGLQEGIIGGKIQMLQELLGEPVASNEMILASSFAELTAQLDALQQRLRSRDA